MRIPVRALVLTLAGVVAPAVGGAAPPRLAAPRTACWTGQTQHGAMCVGVPTACPSGRPLAARFDPCSTVREGTNARCCWPGQVWSTERNGCVGVPSACPSQLDTSLTSRAHATARGAATLRDLDVRRSDLAPFRSHLDPFLCGAEGHACCGPYRGSAGIIGPDHCDAGLGCDEATRTCVSPCGGDGQVCCDGPDTNAGQARFYCGEGAGTCVPTRNMCDAGACDVTTRRCGACGLVAGAACCAPEPTMALATCRGDHLTCGFASDTDWTRGTCVSCGREGQVACLGHACDDQLVEDAQGTCVPCGHAGQPACDGGCVGRTAWVSGRCEACGVANGHVCRTGAKCDPGLLVVGAYCRPCGGEQQPACPTDPKCRAGHSDWDGAAQLNRCSSACGHGVDPKDYGPQLACHEGYHPADDPGQLRFRYSCYDGAKLFADRYSDWQHCLCLPTASTTGTELSDDSGFCIKAR